MSGERGRPTLYTPEIAKEVCDRLSEGESLRSICKDEHLPSDGAIRLWAREDREGFSAQYAEARYLQALFWSDQILDIADDKDEDYQRSRLRVDTRKWLLSKVLPKVYGDKTQHEVTGADGEPLEVVVTRTVVHTNGES